MKAEAHGSLFLKDDPARAIANLDEDEATLAVDAARIILGSAAVDPAKVQRLEVGPGAAVPAWAPHVQVALGLRHVALAPVSAGDPGPTTLRILSDSGRQTARSAMATATLGPGTAPGPGGPAQVHRGVDQDHVRRIREAEARCLAQVPMGAFVSRPTWDASLDARYRLLASTCTACDASHHPPLDPCPRCGRPTRVRAHHEGALHTWTTIAKGGGPTEFDEWQALDGDYVVAIVDLPGGPRVAGMMTRTDPESLRVGQAVRPVLRRLYAQEGAWRYGTKFQTIAQPEDR